MSLKSMIKEFVDPRFSTSEIENSRLKCNLSFETTDMYFDDEKKGFPTHICGVVTTKKGIKLLASWNRHGKCTVQGKRIPSFDLVRPTQKETDSAKPVINSLKVGLIVIIVCIIF